MKLITVAAVLTIGVLIFSYCLKPLQPTLLASKVKVVKPQKSAWRYYSRTDPMTDQATSYEELDNKDLDSLAYSSMIVISCTGRTQMFLVRDGRIFGNGYSDVLIRFDKKKAISDSVFYKEGSLETVAKIEKISSSEKGLGYVITGGDAAEILNTLARTSELRVRAKSVVGSVDLDFDVGGAGAALHNLTSACYSTQHQK